MNQNKKINRSLLAMTVLQIVPLSVFSQKSGERPNILFILCDDMGYGDLACYGQPYIHTPHIDQMAKEGMRFTQAYAGSPVSAPSRATLMTGQHTGHTHVRGNKEYWSRKNTVTYGQNKDFAVVGQEPYDPAHKILPEMLKDRGYRTGVFGKWAGGYEGSPSTPDKRGIDEFYGYICQFQAHLYYPNFLNRYSKSLGDTAVVREVMRQNIQYPMFGKDYFKRQQYSARIIHDKALEWIDQQDGKHPFVGFLTYTLPHAELAQPDDSIVENYKRKFFTDKTWGGWEDSWYNAVEHTHAQFAGMITRLDSYVGEIFNKLKEKGLDKNTIVIFTSDNGPHEEGGADPEFFGRDGKLKGLKRQCYEGGIRIPFIAWWPDHIKAGSVNDTQFAFYDLMPTFCDLAGIKNFAKRYTNKKLADDGFDGISIAPTLLGKDEKQKHHDYLYWEFHETDQIGVRKGDWKLVVVKGKPHLYNLAKDIHEDHDVSAEHPEIVKELVAAIYKEHKDNPSFQVTLPSIQKEFAQHTNDRSQLSPTPPMGWMTWNMFKGDISDQLIRETADAMVEKGFLEAGYQYIFIDDLWQGGRDNHNNIIPDPKKFPNGMKAVADYVHSKGLKLGIYSDAAQLTCGGWTASYGFEEQDARTFASWGIDYLKYDYCNAPEDSATARSRYRRMADALSKSGRDIILGICEWGQRKGEEWCEKVGGQLWRTSYDVRDMWKDTTHQGGMGILDIINISAPLAKHARHGQWMDMDMLVVGLQGKGGPSSDLGGTGCTYTEYQTQMSMWCMLSSVLALSNDLRKLTPEDSRILLNKEIIAINQDSLAQAAICKVSTATHQIYVRPLSDGSHAIAVLNFSDKPLTITADFKALGLKGKYTVRDIWEHRDISKNATRWKGKVNVHETKVFILK